MITQQPDPSKIDWLILNKAKAEDVTYHFPFQREDIRLVYLFRNPITLYYSWKKGWDEMAVRDYALAAANEDKILDWIRALILSELTSFGLYRDQALDTAVSLESFTCQTDENLRKVWGHLDLPFIEREKRPVLESCLNCGSKLKVQETGEAVLYCPQCDQTYLAAGGYNYIGEVNAGYLNAWKAKEKSPFLFDYFSKLLGSKLMRSYEEEAYLKPDSASIFEDVLNEVIDRISAV